MKSARQARSFRPIQLNPKRTGGQFLAIEEGRLWIREFPDVPVTKKPAEVRQGKGKGAIEVWAARVKPGRILFELDGVTGPLAAEAFSRAAMKLPIKTKVVARLGDTTHLGAV